jgi:hypothetical protein
MAHFEHAMIPHPVIGKLTIIVLNDGSYSRESITSDLPNLINGHPHTILMIYQGVICNYVMALEGSGSSFLEFRPE